MTTRHVLLLCMTVLVIGCQPRVDLSAERDALSQTDQKWAEVSAAGSDVERIVAYWSDDARIFPPGMPVVEGKAAIREFVTSSLKIPGFSVTWQVAQAVISPDGRLGYTTGTNRMVAPDSTGKLVTTQGRYVTVWRKESDGSWKCVIDFWNSGA